MIVNICPSARNLSETVSCLNYAARARNTVPSLGNRDTIKKWRDVVSDLKGISKLAIPFKNIHFVKKKN